MEVLRKCTLCDLEAHTEEDLDLFSKRKNRPYGRDYTCKKCSSQRNSARSFGIPFEEYRDIMDNAVRCEICSTTEETLVYDHNHNTGEFRGILCHPCNLMLGNARDTVANLLSGIKYLKERGNYGS